MSSNVSVPFFITFSNEWACYQTAAGYTFFMSSQETFSKIKHMLNHKKEPKQMQENWNQTKDLFQLQCNETRNQKQKKLGKFTNLEMIQHALEQTMDQRRNQ